VPENPGPGSDNDTLQPALDATVLEMKDRSRLRPAVREILERAEEILEGKDIGNGPGR